MSSVKRYYPIRCAVVTPTINNVQYSDGDNLGGLMQFAMRSNGGCGGFLDTFIVADNGNQKPAMELYVFNALPAATFTNNAAFPALTAADQAKLRGVVSVAAADWTTYDSDAWLRKLAKHGTESDRLSLQCDAGIVYVAAKIKTSTPTFTAGDLAWTLIGYMD
jgi:hypothetical protein